MVYTVLVTDGFPCLGFSLAQACAHPEGAVLFFCERPAPKARPEKHGLGNLGLGVLLSRKLAHRDFEDRNLLRFLV